MAYKFVWRSATHEVMAELALRRMPKGMQRLVDGCRPFFDLGICAPDKLFGDSVNHYYNVTPTLSGRHLGKVHRKVAREVVLIEEMLAHPDRVILHPKTERWLRGTIDTPAKAVAFEMGVISHYIADAGQPFHTDGKRRFAEEELVHKTLEFDVRKRIEEMRAGYNPLPVEDASDPEAYILKMVIFANGFYDAWVGHYYRAPGKVQPKERFEAAKDTIQRCFDHAVRGIASVWQLFSRSEAVLDGLAEREEGIREVQCLTSGMGRFRIHQYRNGNVKLILT